MNANTDLATRCLRLCVVASILLTSLPTSTRASVRAAPPAASEHGDYCTHDFDAENRLESVTVDGETTDYVYDGDGNLVKKEDSSGTTIYVGSYYERFSPQEMVIGEAGYLNDTLTHTPQTVYLSRHYVNPVVFAQPVSRDGGDTSVVRITDVQADRFTLYLHEAPNKDGSHTSEAVSYLVLEAGSWELPDGTLLQVGTLHTSATVGKLITNQWEHVGFGLPFSTAPVVVSQVQTNDDPHWVKTRQDDVTETGVKLALEEEEEKTFPHGSETLGWLAMERGTGSWNGHAYEAAQTSDAVTGAWYQISFGQSFGSPPRFLAALATYDGGDSAHLRYSRTSLTTSGVQVMVEEDTTYDDETNHTSEVVSYLAIQGDGTLTGQAFTASGSVVRKYYYAGGARARPEQSRRVAMRVDDGSSDVVYYLHTDHPSTGSGQASARPT